ncbi:DUF1559 domain-containing protein [bacterium]|nr:MAG: DUF1559 domain-containing protein [bacterium]
MNFSSVREPKIFRYSAFTLIELLVVIAIIAILAAILFPVFARARENARKASCQSNLKQIALGIMQYTQDYDEKFFMAEYGGGASGVPQMQWYQAVQPYMKSGTQYGKGGVFQCPSYTSSSNDFAQAYGIHSDLCPSYYGSAPADAKTYSLSILQNPSDKVLVAEKGNSGTSYSYPVFVTSEIYWTTGVGNPKGSKDDNDKVGSSDCDDVGGASYECAAMPRYRHLNTSNMLFADGHVKAMVKGRVRWFTNIYIAGTSRPGDSYNGFQWDGERAGWYPWAS